MTHTPKPIPPQVERDATMLRQYSDLKSKHPDRVLIFRDGDFYVMWEDDAEVGQQVLGLALRAHEPRRTEFPLTALGTYLPRLIRADYRVCICDPIK